MDIVYYVTKCGYNPVYGNFVKLLKKEMKYILKTSFRLYDVMWCVNYKVIQ
jgi:hypothetical protein